MRTGVPRWRSAQHCYDRGYSRQRAYGVRRSRHDVDEFDDVDGISADALRSPCVIARLETAATLVTVALLIRAVPFLQAGE